MKILSFFLPEYCWPYEHCLKRCKFTTQTWLAKNIRE